jgi:putative endonuclease
MAVIYLAATFPLPDPGLSLHQHSGRYHLSNSLIPRMSEQKIPCTYIMASKPNGVLYIGVTSNLAQRVYQHKQGLLGGFSQKYNVKRLVYYELHNDMENAIKWEKRLKKYPRQWKINLIEQDNPTWEDLYTSLLQ